MRIVVLAGGLSTERDVSISSGIKVASALREKGNEVVLLDKIRERALFMKNKQGFVMIQELSLSTDFTPFTVFIFFINTFNILVSRINTVKLPWKSPSTESILNDLRVTPDSLLITDVMLVTMAISSLPTTRSEIA